MTLQLGYITPPGGEPYCPGCERGPEQPHGEGCPVVALVARVVAVEAEVARLRELLRDMVEHADDPWHGGQNCILETHLDAARAALADGPTGRKHDP